RGRVATTGDRREAQCGVTATGGLGAVTEGRITKTGGDAVAADRRGRIARCGAAEAVGGCLLAAGDCFGAGRGAVGAQCAGTGTGRGRADLAGRGARADRGAVISRSNGVDDHRIAIGVEYRIAFVVEHLALAADGDAGISDRLACAATGDAVVALGDGVVAAGRTELADRERTATERRGSGADRCAGRTDRGRIVALGIGVAAHGDRVFAENGRLVGTAGLEAHIGVFSDRGHCVELGEVDRVGRLGAGGDVGQLALRTGAADGHAVFAVRDRAATKRNGANGRRIGAITDRGGVHAVCGAVRADR